MQVREEPFVNRGIYHIFNKTIDRRKIFMNQYFCTLFCKLLSYYRLKDIPISYSRRGSLSGDRRSQLYKNLHIAVHRRIDILAYNLMPNHFHLLLYQRSDGGIQQYVSDCVNALTRHYNLKTNRVGPIFLRRFESKSIKDDEYLMHVSRYIHLNQYASGISTLHEAALYRWSSYREYLTNPIDRLTDDRRVMELFNFNMSRYQRFVDSEAEDQRTREVAKHAYKWELVRRQRQRYRYLEP